MDKVIGKEKQRYCPFSTVPNPSTLITDRGGTHLLMPCFKEACQLWIGFPLGDGEIRMDCAVVALAVGVIALAPTPVTH